MAWIFPPAGSFHRVCRYVCQDPGRSLVLDQEGVRGHDPLRMAQDFEIIRGLRPGREKSVFHGVLDFHPDEKIDDIKMVEIARKYLEQIGRTDTQFAIVKHFDKRHPHVHIIANRVHYDGEYVTGFPERLKSKDAADSLVREYQLMPVREEKNLRQTNLEALDRSETRLYTIYRSIKECLPGCQSLEELEARLLKRGIDTQYRYNEQTGERKGISFRYEKEAFKGSRVDRAFSFGRLEKTLVQQQELVLWEKQKQAQLEKEKLAQLEKEKLARQEEQRKAQRQQPQKGLRREGEQEQDLRQRKGNDHRHSHGHDQGYELGF